MRPDRRAVVFGLGGAALTAAAKARAAEGEPMFRIGAIADPQFADRDDAPPRRFRLALKKFVAAVAELNRHDLSFVALLGDFIDGGWENFAPMLGAARATKHPWRFVLGNHDFNVADGEKPAVPALLGLPARHYAFDHGGWRFLVLDAGDLSTFAWPAGGAEDALGRKAHEEKYPEAKPWNGGIGEKQLSWLDGELARADAEGVPVTMMCHMPIHPGADDSTRMWNADEVLARIVPHPSAKLWLDGHEHDGGYAETAGLHFLNLKGMLDGEETAFAILEYYPGRIAVRGFGREESRSLELR
jgi:manganese-dependent ADP-ribose/CDP-alcohol diphosphatase